MGTMTLAFSGLGVILAYMTALWVASLIVRNSSIVDIFWGLGFVVVGGVYFALGHGDLARRLLLMTLVAVWGLRLSLFIAMRNIGKGEDKRYQVWRNENGARWWWKSFFQVFLLQGIIMWIVSSTLLIGQVGPSLDVPSPLDALGVLAWAVGFTFEAAGDWQLARFKADPANKGRVMDRGLWRYTRHPNYFGEAAMWWGFGLIALGAPGGVLALIGPALMTFLLMRVSGVTLLEKSMETRPGYREYVQRTSAFFPWPPRQS